MRPGPTRQAVGQARDILSTFRLFFTPEIEDIILEMTNLEGVRKYGARGDGDDDDDDHRHYADDHENHENHEDRDRGGGGGRWKAMDSTDLRAYVGLLILAGVYRSRGEAASSLWDAESGRTIFRATMPLKVFHAYLRLLRFDDRQTRAERRAAGGGDKLAAVREVWDKWVERLPLLYNPGPDVTVDEQLVPFRGRCPFRQYIPSKPAKYGIKTWVACDSKSSYAWKMQVYTGKATCGGPEKNQGMRVVLDLTQGLRGHNVTCDNFFTSYELARQLLTRNVTVVGTVRKNKPELPQALLASKDRLLFSSKFAFTSTTALVSYLAKKNKNVLLLSTLHTEAHVSRRQDKKPAIVLDYNSNKGGVDNLDKVIGTYSCRRMTARWPLVIFHNILDVSSYNAFVIWRELNPTWMPGKRNKRRVFLEQLGKALVTPFIQRRARLPRTEASAALVKAVQRATYRDQPRRDHAPAAPDHAAPPAQAPNPTQPSDQLEDTRLQETEPGDQYESNNSPVDDQHLYDSDACGNSFRQHTFSPADSNRSDSETDCQATMAGDYNDWTYEHEHDTLSDTVEDTRSQEEDTPPQYGSNTRHADRDNVYKEAVEDYFDVDDDDVEDMVRAEEDAKKHQQIDLMLKWSILNRTWHSFLEWLGARWWGSVSADQISSFMGGRKIRFGDIVIAAHFGDMPGGVCSVTAKTQNEVLTFHVAICGGSYICKDLVEGDFSTPIDIIRHLVDKLGEGRILRQHWTIPHNPDYFSVTHIAGQMCYMMKVLKDSWWGASYGNEVWSPHYREVIEHLRKKGPMYENPAAAIHYMDDVSLGYLFDIVTAFGNRFKVTFDTFGFTVGTRARFSDIAGVLSYISRIDRVTFVSPPCSLMHADQSLGDVDYIANPQRVVHSRATCNVLQL
ncbi:uncharacterized protein LOC123485190 [Coregonus clupeaformis]|uniref:uncharacterized protein LOC123485190 n=1 Tax=Coregonus clupeaformis TaxID=59861 RepID=UPI001E1C7CF2|nr:uncharacterized protein LOC123485190 [Coregonus clupeaformis]